MEGEIWRDVPGEPHMQASSFGRVKQKPYEKTMPNGGVRVYDAAPTFGVARKASKTARHEYMGCLFRGKNYKVHRLVCAAFHGPAPFLRAVVIHLDENAKNNHFGNLKWGTQKENLNSKNFIEYCKSRVGDLSPTRKALMKIGR